MTTKSPAKRNGSQPTDLSTKLLGRLGQRYGVDPGKLLATLRDTVFRPPKKDARPFSDNEIAAALVLAEKYDLDPFAKQLYVTRSRGALLVIVPIDGWAAIVNRQETFDGVQFEYEDDGDKLISCTCTMHDRRRRHPVIVTEYFDECFAPKSDDKTDPWRKWPRRMLRHKAFNQAARLCYGLAGIIDPDEADRMEVPDYRVVEGERPSLPPPSQAPERREVEQSAESEDKIGLWDVWQELIQKLNPDQIALCRKAAGVNMLSRDASIDQLDAAIAEAEGILEHAEG